MNSDRFPPPILLLLLFLIATTILSPVVTSFSPPYNSITKKLYTTVPFVSSPPRRRTIPIGAIHHVARHTRSIHKSLFVADDDTTTTTILFSSISNSESSNEEEESSSKEEEESSSSSSEESNTNGVISNRDELVERSAIALRRVSWVSWWSQVILTTVSSVTLLFARSVMNANARQGGLRQGSGFFLAGSGITLSILSIIWTWGNARLSRRLLRRNTTRVTAANLLRRSITIGVTINLLGMLLTIVGAEQIVGILATKVLTTQGISPFSTGGAAAAAVATQVLQPLDILVVQANTNTLLSHFAGLSLRLWFSRWIQRLVPPPAATASSDE